MDRALMECDQVLPLDPLETYETAPVFESGNRLLNQRFAETRFAHQDQAMRNLPLQPDEGAHPAVDVPVMSLGSGRNI